MPLMPGSREVFDMARLCGAKAVYVSGAGSTVMAVAEKGRGRKVLFQAGKRLELLDGLDGCEAFTLLQLDADNAGALWNGERVQGSPRRFRPASPQARGERGE